jgi:hypothetical protein
MKKTFAFFCILFILSSSFTILKVDNSLPSKNTTNTIIDKNWETMARINKFYIQKIVKSNLPIKSMKEFSVENLSKVIGVSEEKIKNDIATLKKAAANYLRENKISKDCESCTINREEKQQKTLVVLNKLRDDKAYSDNFFKNAFSHESKVLEDGGGCQRWISYAACCAVCVATLGEFPPFAILCAAACYCEYCCGGCC